MDICLLYKYAFGATKRRPLRQERWCRIQLVVSHRLVPKVPPQSSCREVEQRLQHILYATAPQREFPHLKSRLPTLWSRSYYAGTVGQVSEATVKKYIESQKGR